MTKHIVLLLTIINIYSNDSSKAYSQNIENREKITPISFTNITLQDNLWRIWENRNKDVIIPHVFKMCKQTGIINNFEIAAKLKEGSYQGLKNGDEVLYKAIEGASYVLAKFKDKKLDNYLDSLINIISMAQEEDGYLFTYRTINLKLGHKLNDKPRWSNPKDNELYYSGHLYEAACAHYQATNKNKLLNVAIKNANLVDSIFGENKKRDVCGHPNVEQALMRLYNTTNDIRYFNLGKFFIEERGYSNNGRKLLGAFAQDHKPLIEQTEAVGQAPRATYLYSGAADLDYYSNNYKYYNTLEILWNNIVSKKTYITGGIGSRHDNEGFGDDYDLPNKTAYTETCAAVSFSMWNHRMFLLSGDSKYIDMLERTIYNNFLAGTSLKGNTFFYANPLEADGIFKFNRGDIGSMPGEFKEPEATRKPWFYCACCPPNVARFIPWVPTYMYAVNSEDIYINLFIASTAAVKTKSNNFKIIQKTNYPWDGKINIVVYPQKSQSSTIKIRIPSWSKGNPIPSDLYTYWDNKNLKIELKINGKNINYTTEKGYAILNRVWKKGDKIFLNIPMPIRKVISNPKLQENKDKIAIEKGPIVYCLEGADNSGEVLNIFMPEKIKMKSEFKPNFLGGVNIIKGNAVHHVKTDSIKTKTHNINFTAIPYNVWSNRGIGEMIVWIPTEKK